MSALERVLRSLARKNDTIARDRVRRFYYAFAI